MVKKRQSRRQSGFTLLELLVALSVAAILLGIGVPSFTEAIRNSRIGAQQSQALRSLYLARSEAVKSGEFVVVCTRSAPESRTCGDADDWNNGWIVFVDTDGDIDDAAMVEDGDTIISLEPAIEGDNVVSAYASLASGDTPDKVGHVRYLPRGNADWQGGSIVVCDTGRGAESSRVVNVRLTGAIESGRPNADESVPRDAFNALIDCAAGGEI